MATVRRVNFFITHLFKLYYALNFCIIKGVATRVAGGLLLLLPLSTHLPPFCPFSIIWELRSAKMTTAGSAHFELQKSSPETYGWRYGHYVHFFFTVYGLLVLSEVAAHWALSVTVWKGPKLLSKMWYKQDIIYSPKSMSRADWNIIVKLGIF